MEGLQKMCCVHTSSGVRAEEVLREIRRDGDPTLIISPAGISLCWMIVKKERRNHIFTNKKIRCSKCPPLSSWKQILRELDLFSQ